MCNCKGNCSCDSGSSEKQLNSLQAQVAELSDALTKINESVLPFIDGHPILLIQNTDDIAQFDLTGGAGFNTWKNWAVCNGTTHYSSKDKANILTPNFTDRFIVQAGGSYAVDDIGGLDSVALTDAQNGTHTHNVVDLGHTHNIVDPGHTHQLVDNGHDHSAVSTPHSHTLTIDAVGDHQHGTGFTIIGDNNTGTNFNALNDGLSGSSTGPAGAHTHSGMANPASVASTIGTSFTGINMDPAFVGITETEIAPSAITIQDRGLGDPHENRPPYYAAIYVMKID